MNKQKIIIPSGIGLAAILWVGQLSWLDKLWDKNTERHRHAHYNTLLLYWKWNDKWHLQ